MPSCPPKVRQRIAELPTGLAPAVGPRPAAAGPQTARTPPAPLTLDIPARTPSAPEALSAPTSGAPRSPGKRRPAAPLGHPSRATVLAPAGLCADVLSRASLTLPACGHCQPLPQRAPGPRNPRRKSVTRWTLDLLTRGRRRAITLERIACPTRQDRAGSHCRPPPPWRDAIEYLKADSRFGVAQCIRSRPACSVVLHAKDR